MVSDKIYSEEYLSSKFNYSSNSVNGKEAAGNKVAVKAMKKHTVQATNEIPATGVEKRMLELGIHWNT